MSEISGACAPSHRCNSRSTPSAGCCGVHHRSVDCRARSAPIKPVAARTVADDGFPSSPSPSASTMKASSSSSLVVCGSKRRWPQMTCGDGSDDEGAASSSLSSSAAPITSDDDTAAAPHANPRRLAGIPASSPPGAPLHTLPMPASGMAPKRPRLGDATMMWTPLALAPYWSPPFAWPRCHHR